MMAHTKRPAGKDMVFQVKIYKPWLREPINKKIIPFMRGFVGAAPRTPLSRGGSNQKKEKNKKG